MRYRVYLHWSDEDKAWLAEVPDLPGCMADGETPEQAVNAAHQAANLWLEVAKEEGRPIPQPTEAASGKFVVRIPKSLHRRLQLLAERENVSLNQLVTSLLAEREAEKRSRER
jgi:antitoxin HicB